MPLVSQKGLLIVEVVDGVLKLGTSEECCCYFPTFACVRPTSWRIVEAEGEVYAEGPVSSTGDLNNFPSPWVAYWYTKTDLSMKLEVDFPNEGWKTLEEWESEISICGEGPFASHAWGAIEPPPDPPVPPWQQPEPFECVVGIGNAGVIEPGQPKWFCVLTDKEKAAEDPDFACACFYGGPGVFDANGNFIANGVEIETQAFNDKIDCSEFCCGEQADDCIPCYLQPGTPYEVKVPPPGDYTFDGEVDGEWNNARNWFDEYDVPPTSTRITVSDDVTTLTGSPVVVSAAITISSGASLGIKVTVVRGAGAQVIEPTDVFGSIAATGECEGGRGILNGFARFQSSGYLDGDVEGAAAFYDNSYTNAGSELKPGTEAGIQQLYPGIYDGYFGFNGNSVNKSGCDTSGTYGLAFMGQATNEATVGNGVLWYENAKNAAGAMAGIGAVFDGRNVDILLDWAYGYSVSYSPPTPRTGGNYGTVGDYATFRNGLDNYSIAEGDATFDDADNETAGEVQGNGDFQNNANNKGTVVGDGSFDTAATNAATGVVQGNGDFEGDSQNLGTVWGDASFSNDGGTASNGGTVQDNAEFFNEATNAAGGTVQGDATLYGSASNAGNVVGNADFTQFSYNDGGTVGGDATFVDSSEGRSGEITGNATFSGSSNSGGTEAGTLVVGGDATYSGTSQNLGTLQATGAVTFQSGTSNYGTVAGDATFEAGATNYGTVEGVGTFNGGTNAGTVEGNADFTAGAINSGTVQGNATFNASSSSGTVSGNATFEAASTNSGTVNGTASFTGASSNSGEVEGNATFATGSSSSGIVGGTALFDASTHNADGEVAGATTFQNAAANYGRVLSTSLFDASTNEVGGQVLADATFQNGSANNGTVALAATLNDTSTNAGAVGNGSVFNGTSENTSNGSVQGSATFNGSSTNNGSVTGNATFNGSSNNFGTVLGTKTCNTTGTC